MPTRTAYWICQILGWSAYSVIALWFGARSDGWTPAIIAGFALYPFYSIALTHLLRREMRRRQWAALRLGKIVVRLFLAAVAIGLIQTILIAAVNLVFDRRRSLLFEPVSLLYVALGTTWITGIWVTLYALLTAKRHHGERETQLQLALREAELRALEAQLNPHFLFNCLNSIRGLVVENPTQAQDMITRLANILRYNLHRDVNHTVPLASEVEVVGDYLALESIRFEDRLHVRFAIGPGADQIPIPSMLLQTLVENALKHGIAPLPAGGELLIRASVDRGSMVVEVENTGRLAEPGPDSTGVGLDNARERLRILYGGRASLKLRNREDGHVVATVLIPNTA
jgi:two-component system, LytTR family, sensor histidine kinase AlgZ